MPSTTPSDEHTLGEKSLGTSLAERKTAHLYDVRKKSLFDMVDTDHSGTGTSLARSSTWCASIRDELAFDQPEQKRVADATRAAAIG